MQHFMEAFLTHHKCPSFRARVWDTDQEWGFSCRCHLDLPVEWRVSAAQQRWLDPEDLYVLQDRFGPVFRRQERRDAVKAHKANQRARVLLHSHLTREQIRELNHTGAFTVVGGDGEVYRLESKYGENIFLLKSGTPVKRICVVFKGSALPINDLLLAQKLMLENCPQQLFEKARVTDLRAQDTLENTWGATTEEAVWEAAEHVCAVVG